MRHGNINCSCGQTFYFESAATGAQRTVGCDEDNRPISQYFPPSVTCIRCGKSHDISAFPDAEPVEQPTEVEFVDVTEPPTEEGDGDGTDV